ncbi:MAG: ABC transporter substrate-binding protein [Thermodesulfobacteriota bacterium]
MLKRVWWLLVCVSALIMAVSPAWAAEKEYINGIDANFPPFAYVSKDGKPGGFDVDAVDWIAKQMGFKVKHQPMDWDGIIPNLVAKKIDFIASGMTITDARKKQVNFTNPYWDIKQVLVVKKDSKVTVDQAMKGGKKVGVQRGTTEADWLKTNHGKDGRKYELVYYDSAPLSVEDVLNGRIEAAAMDDAPAHDAVGKKPVKILGEFGMNPEKFGYAVRKEDKELLDKLNEGLKKLMASPYWKELIAKHKPGGH